MFICVPFLCLSAFAEVRVSDAWVRGTVPAQRATGAFMKITSTEEARVVGASSPAAKVVEIHEMAMKEGRMEMRAVESLALPANRAVELKPGGYHLMLMELSGALKAGDTVPITFIVVGTDGRRNAVEFRAEVRALGARDAPAAHKH